MSVELVLWLLLAFFIGGIIGCLLRWLFAPEPGSAASTANIAAAGTATATAVSAPQIAEAEIKAKTVSSTVPARTASPSTVKPKPVAKSATSAATKSKPALEKKAPASKPKKARATGKPKRPRGLAAARGGKADNLQEISGVGPKLEKTLNGLGFFHFSQIADWNSDEIKWVDEHLRFKGRIERDKWIRQARALAKGKSSQSTPRTSKKRGS